MSAPELPRHVSIIMDGNGRWAECRGKPRIYGHIRGASRVRELIRETHRLGIHALTLYAFSTENWNRPADEVGTLMRLLLKWLSRERREMMRNNIRFRALGSVERLPAEVLAVVRETEEMSRGNTGLQFSLALSYGGREEILCATRRLARRAARGELDPAAIDQKAFSRELYSAEIGDPDLLIRTSGEQRVSNFMLWQLAYTELHFVESFWPDFTAEHFHEALQSYASRERRFGLVKPKAKEATA